MDETAALIFMAMCIFVPMLLPYLDNKTIIEKETVKYVYVEKEKPKNSKQSIEVASKINYKLLDDCIQCLVSLGLNKKEAKKRTEELFKTNNYQSIESFLMDAYKIQ
jgi:predicted transcriptional regulator